MDTGGMTSVGNANLSPSNMYFGQKKSLPAITALKNILQLKPKSFGRKSKKKIIESDK